MAINVHTPVEPNAEIYIFECMDFFKVGRAVNAQHRLKICRTGNPFRLTLIEFHPVPARLAHVIEFKIHQDLQSYRAQRGGPREWFLAPLQVVQTVVHLHLRRHGHAPAFSAVKPLPRQQGLTQADVDFLKDETYEADGRSEFVDGLPHVRIPWSSARKR